MEFTIYIFYLYILFAIYIEKFLKRRNVNVYIKYWLDYVYIRKNFYNIFCLEGMTAHFFLLLSLYSTPPLHLFHTRRHQFFGSCWSRSTIRYILNVGSFSRSSTITEHRCIIILILMFVVLLLLLHDGDAPRHFGGKDNLWRSCI